MQPIAHESLTKPLVRHLTCLSCGMLMLVLEFVAVLLLADFVSGLVHWIEDSFWSETTPLLGRWLVQPNLLHHRDGRAFLAKSWWQSSWDLLLAGVAVLAGAFALGLLTWHVVLFVALVANANQFHKWSHMEALGARVAPGTARAPALVRALQRTGILQSARHHSIHHRGAKNTHYCVITGFVDPVLDRIGFWRGLERLVLSPRTAPRRTDLWAENTRAGA